MGTSRRRYWKLTRAGEINANPQTIEQRAAAFAAGATARGGYSTLVAVRDEDGLHDYLIMPDTSSADSSAISLAQCVAARLNPLDEAPDLSFTPAVAQLWWRRSSAGIRATQAGTDLAEVSRILGNTLPLDSWVAAVVRSPHRLERRWWSNWLAYRMGTVRPTHHSTVREALVTSIWAGSDSPTVTADILDSVASSLPGFDVGTRTHRPPRLAHLVMWLLVAAAMLTPSVLTLTPVPVPGWLSVFTWAVSLAGAGLAVLLGVAAWKRILPTRDARIRRGLPVARLPRPKYRVRPPRRPSTVHTEHVGAEDRTDGGSYPLRREALMLGPHIPASLVAPHAGALSGAASTRSRGVPVEMTRNIGPLIGHDQADGPVHISSADTARGLAVLGEPGSGKSILVQNVLAHSMLERVHPLGLPGFPGRRNALVSFETKLDGAKAALDWARAVGDKVALVEVANPNSWAIDLFAVPGTIETKALHFTNALQYAFADGSIRDESFRTLKMVLTGALAVTDEMTERVDGVKAGGSPIYYASIFMGRAGDGPATELAAAVHDAHEQALHEGKTGADATIAWESLVLMYGPTVTPSQRAALQRAPGNKIDQLLALDHFFAPARRKFSWADLIEGHKAAIVLTGRDSAGNIMESNMEQLMSSLLMFSLRYNIERTCAGWEAAGRWVSIFADELKELAGSSPDIITWLRNKGRSYGVRPHFATQYPAQLDTQVRDALLSFPTLIAFKQNSPAIARELVDDFGGDGTDWSSADILGLAPFHAIVRASVGHQRQAPFSFASAYFIDPATGLPDIDRFRAEQGYQSGGGAA